MINIILFLRKAAEGIKYNKFFFRLQYFIIIVHFQMTILKTCQTRLNTIKDRMRKASAKASKLKVSCGSGRLEWGLSLTEAYN